MSYFNHAFTKRFLGTGVTRNIGSTGAAQSIGNPYSTDGFITTAGVSTVTLSQLPSNGGTLPLIGYYGFFDSKTYKSVNTAIVTASPGCPLILASTSLLRDDKIGAFHGGYKETNKSKIINPKYVSRVYRVDSCEPQQTAISIGNTPYTDDRIASIAINTVGASIVDGTYDNLTTTGGTGSGAIITIVVSGGVVILVTLVNGGTGYTNGDTLTLVNDLPTVGAGTQPDFEVTSVTLAANCCREFLCDETYYLRVDVKGSPALRALNHNAYQTVSAYTGCCSGPTPTAVDSTTVFIQWAEQITTTAYLKDFVFAVVYDEAGVPWFAPETTVDPDGVAVTPLQWWTNYVSPGHVDGECAGLRLFGAYVETRFGDCSFQVTDFFEKEPVKILASLVDYTGDPCIFEGLCVVEECPGLQGNGFGEQVLRDFILSESYLQNFFHTDIRIREITQGDDILNAIDRNALYTRYYIQHNVPRFNNPSGVFDNDQYMLEIITDNANAALETFITTWLGDFAPCEGIEEFSCGTCTVPLIQPD